MSLVIFSRDPLGLIHPNNTLVDLFAALARKERPLRADGTAYDVTMFQNGYLFDGLPLNVVIEQKWYPGQQEALQPAWNSGAIARPSAVVLSYPIVGAPAAGASPIATPAAGVSPMLLIGGALLLLWWFRK